MKFPLSFNKIPATGALVTAVALLLAGVAFAQGTTSSIRVVVTDVDGGAPVGGVQVSITHLPTGRTQILT